MYKIKIFLNKSGTTKQQTSYKYVINVCKKNVVVDHLGYYKLQAKTRIVYVRINLKKLRFWLQKHIIFSNTRVLSLLQFFF